MKKILMISFLIFTILLGTLNISYAKITVTEEALQNAFNQIIKAQSTGENDDSSITFTNIQVNSSNKIIKFIDTDNNTYNVSYDLSNKPTFSHEIFLEEGMVLDEFNSLFDTEAIISKYVYIAAIMSLGISYKSANLYLSFTHTIFSYLSYANETILPNYEAGVINYFESILPAYPSFTILDAYLDTFSITREKEILNKTSGKLKSTITLNPDADFSKINGYTTQPNVTPEILPEAVLIVPPTQTKYDVGEELNLDGLKITAVYENNKIEEVTKGYTVKGYNKNKEGTQTVTISYKGVSRSYEVRVGNVSYDVESEGKLPQTGNFSYLQTGLYLLIGILSLALIYLVYKSFKYRK